MLDQKTLDAISHRARELANSAPPLNGTQKAKLRVLLTPALRQARATKS